MVGKVISKIALVTLANSAPNRKTVTNIMILGGDLEKVKGMGIITGGVIESTILEESDEVVEVAPGVFRTNKSTERIVSEEIPPNVPNLTPPVPPSEKPVEVITVSREQGDKTQKEGSGLGSSESAKPQGLEKAPESAKPQGLEKSPEPVKPQGPAGWWKCPCFWVIVIAVVLGAAVAAVIGFLLGAA